MIRRLWPLLAFAVATAAGNFAAVAQTYPTKPVTFIVPFAAGGGAEVNARAVADDLGKALGQPIVIDARPGANGAIGSAVVAKSAPDGYTLLFTAQSTFSVNPHLMKELPYDQLKNFVPVASVGRAPWFLVVPKDSPFKTVKDVVDYAKANPDKVTAGFWQSSILVTTTAFGKTAGIQIRRVPYKGVVEAVTDLIANRLNLLFVDYNAVRGHVEAGNARVLASTTAQRSKLFGDNIPTMTELGYPVVTDSMVAIFAPAGTPKPIVERINAEMVKIVGTSAPVRARLAQIGIEPSAMSLSELDGFVRSELPRWGKLIEDAGLQKQ
jgi:tripartite-type tricarboxylate transporter receptor subunit TctC